MYQLNTRAYSPIGELIRLVVMERLSKGASTVEEINELAKKAVEKVGLKYDWRIWTELLKMETVIKDGIVELSEVGKWIYTQTREEIIEYLKKWKLLDALHALC